MKHIVNLVVSQPDHDFVSMRSRRQEKTCIQEANTPEEAMNRATRRYKSLGFYVHGASIMEQKESNQQITEGYFSRVAAGLADTKARQQAAKEKAQKEVDASRPEEPTQAGADYGKRLKAARKAGQPDPQNEQTALEKYLARKNMVSEEVEQIDEKKMTDAQMKRREEIVKGMKPLADWEKRYPGRGKEVMYATATKMAMAEEAVQEGRAMEYKMSRSTIAGDRGNSRGGEITVPQEDREEIARILAKEEPNKSEQDVELEEAVSRKHFQQVADLIKSNPDEAKRKELAQHHAEIFAGQNPRFDRSRFYAAAGVKLEEAKADPVAKAKELLDQAEKGTYKGSAAKLQKALEKAKSKNFDQGKGYKLEEDAEQLDETGAVKKLNKSLKNLNLRSKGARALIGSGLTAQNLNLKNKKGEYLKQRDVNLAAGRTLSAGNLEEGSEGTAPTTPKEKELAKHYGDPNKITHGDVVTARIKSGNKQKAAKATDKILDSARNNKSKKGAKTVVGGDTIHKVETNPTAGDASKTLGVGGK